MSSDKRTKKLFILIKRTFQVNLGCIFLILSSSVIYGYLLESDEQTIEIGAFVYARLILDAGVLSLIIYMSFTLWYSSKVTFKLFSKEIRKRKSSIVLISNISTSNKN